MKPAIKINDLSVRILIEMVVDEKNTLFKTCATKIVNELDTQIQASSNLKQISRLQQQSSMINQMINEYAVA
ncbi:MAG: hypothetical protein NXI20_17050 [bacterium]|jgi:hypothetical protein|nr:hypothetical protein [bacterium]